jgi:hypothetical protein
MAILYGYEVYPDLEITTRLSVAVSLMDDFTGEQPIGSVMVFLSVPRLEPIKNPSGYYLFLDLPDSEYQVRVESAYYFDVNEKVVPANLAPLNPVIEIILKPKPSYPFSSGTTLIRGMVRDSDENPVPGAQVEVSGKGINNMTSEKGLKDDDLINDKFIKDNGDKIVFLEAINESASGKVEVEQVEVGKTTILEAPIIISQ